MFGRIYCRTTMYKVNGTNTNCVLFYLTIKNAQNHFRAHHCQIKLCDLDVHICC